MNPLISFLASSNGRLARVAAGLFLIAWGLLGLHSVVGTVVAIVGVVPFVAGVFDVCVFAPLFGMPLSGPRIRAGK